MPNIETFDEETIYKAGIKLIGKDIKDIQNDINKYINSNTKRKEINKYIYTKNNIQWYDGYTIYDNNSIGIFVCIFNYREADYNEYDISEFEKVKAIIQNKKLPVKFSIKKVYDDICPIEICISIQDLIKIDKSINTNKSISKYDANSALKNIIKRHKSIHSNISKMINKYNLEDICQIFICVENYTNTYNPNSKFKNYMDIILMTYSKVSKELDNTYPNLKFDIEYLMKKNIPFKFEVFNHFNKDYGFGIIGISVDYDDMKYNKDLLKYLNETSTIFESVRFI